MSNYFSSFILIATLVLLIPSPANGVANQISAEGMSGKIELDLKKTTRHCSDINVTLDQADDALQGKTSPLGNELVSQARENPSFKLFGTDGLNAIVLSINGNDKLVACSFYSFS